jgi:endonuclease YncB( thermonuclease family)
MTNSRTCAASVGLLTLLVAGCATPSAPAANPTFAPAANAMPTPSTPTACYDSGPYDGTGGCHAGGEFVTVRHVLDGATVELVDGRRVRLAGVLAPEASGCAGGAATNFALLRLSGQEVHLYREPGAGQDENGSLWGYLRYGPTLAADLGADLAQAGWVTPYGPDPVNPDYLRNVTTWVAQANSQQLGQYGTACAPIAAAPTAPLPLAQVPATAPSPPQAPKVKPPSVPTFDYTEPTPEPEPKATKRHTGHTGHPCGPGERDGDHDGYCGEGR